MGLVMSVTLAKALVEKKRTQLAEREAREQKIIDKLVLRKFPIAMKRINFVIQRAAKEGVTISAIVAGRAQINDAREIRAVTSLATQLRIALRELGYGVEEKHCTSDGVITRTLTIRW